MVTQKTQFRCLSTNSTYAEVSRKQYAQAPPVQGRTIMYYTTLQRLAKNRENALDGESENAIPLSLHRLHICRSEPQTMCAGTTSAGENKHVIKILQIESINVWKQFLKETTETKDNMFKQMGMTNVYNGFWYFKLNSRADVLFSYRREKVGMGYSKEIDRIYWHFRHSKTLENEDYLYISKSRTSIVEMLWTEPPFRANLLSGMLKVVLIESPFLD